MFKNKYKYEVRNKIEWLPLGHGGELTNIAPYFLPKDPKYNSRSGNLNRGRDRRTLNTEKIRK